MGSKKNEIRGQQLYCCRQVCPDFASSPIVGRVVLKHPVFNHKNMVGQHQNLFVTASITTSIAYNVTFRSVTIGVYIGILSPLNSVKVSASKLFYSKDSCL